MQQRCAHPGARLAQNSHWCRHVAKDQRCVIAKSKCLDPVKRAASRTGLKSSRQSVYAPAGGHQQQSPLGNTPLISAATAIAIMCGIPTFPVQHEAAPCVKESQLSCTSCDKRLQISPAHCYFGAHRARILSFRLKAHISCQDACLADVGKVPGPGNSLGYTVSAGALRLGTPA